MYLSRTVPAALLVLALSLAGASVAIAAPTAVSVDCVGDGFDPEDCVPVDPPPTTEEPIPPVEEPSVEDPPAEQPSVPEESDTYYDNDTEDDPAVVVPVAPVAVPTPTPTPTATPTPAPTYSPIRWDFPLYTGEPQHDANVTALGAFVLSLVAAGVVGAYLLIRKLIASGRLGRTGQNPPHPSTTPTETPAPGLADFDLAVRPDRTDRPH